MLNGMEYAFLKSDNRLIFSTETFKNIRVEDSLEDVEEYIIKMVE